MLQRPRQTDRFSLWAAGALVALSTLFSAPAAAQSTTFVLDGLTYTSTQGYRI